MTILSFRATSRAALLIALSLTQGCEPQNRDGQAGNAPMAVDSVVLERTRCYGTCPAYRVRLAATGDVAFESRNPGDSGRVATDHVMPESVRGLLAQATALGFDSLPGVIADDAQLCANKATDHLTVTVTLFRPGNTKQVADYLGCHMASDDSTSVMARLRSFENAVDSTAGSSRWIPPAGRQ